MYRDIIKFWFNDMGPQDWWRKDAELDQSIEHRFGALHSQAIAGELFHWRTTAQGCLAEIIILDQFFRNIYRDKPESFAYDSQALVLAQMAIAKGANLTLSSSERSFLYLPFMHSESSLIHEEALRLFQSLGDEQYLVFELKHKAIIDQFGRYPHRNAILGRQSTQEEIEFLQQPNSSF